MVPPNYPRSSINSNPSMRHCTGFRRGQKLSKSEKRPSCGKFCTLFNSVDPNVTPVQSYDRTWVLHFLRMAVASVKKDAMAGAFSNVTIINFNYDRTIEHFLYSELQRNFHLNEDDARTSISGLKIVRPYGTVGPLPWQEGTGVPFGLDLGSGHEKLFAISNGICTYTEWNVTEQLLSDIRVAIMNATVVVFLGFGFHQQNMQILTAGGSINRVVFATVLGIDYNNYERMARIIKGCERLR
jgi:hypothetical protein